MLNKYRAVCYKDTTPKSELVVAVSQFELLVGFRPLREIKRNILSMLLSQIWDLVHFKAYF